MKWPVSEVKSVRVVDGREYVDINAEPKNADALEHTYYAKDAAAAAELAEQIGARLGLSESRRETVSVVESAALAGIVFAIVGVIGGLLIAGVNSENGGGDNPRLGRAAAFKKLVELLGPTAVTILCSLLILASLAWVIKQCLARPMSTTYSRAV